MATIKPALLKAIQDRTGLSRAQTYARIQQTASSDFLPRHLAAIKVGADVGVTINKYATPEELAQLRQAGSPLFRVGPFRSPASIRTGPSGDEGERANGQEDDRQPGLRRVRARSGSAETQYSVSFARSE